MNPIDWRKIKEQVYYWDGSWRDIYVLEMTRGDWGKWIDLINEKYSVKFYNGQTQQLEATINKNVLFDFFNRKSEFLNSATITLGNILVQCRFFTDKDIENDIDPREVHTVEDHHRLMSYLTDISKVLNKTVVLTAENEQKTVYVSVNRDNVKFHIE